MKKNRQSHNAFLEPIEGSDDLLLIIPDAILVSDDWRASDVLNLEATPGRIVIKNLSKLERERV